MEMHQTRTPHAIPAVVLGIAGLMTAVLFSGLFGILLALGATMIGGRGYADSRGHGYTGGDIALLGALLGIATIALIVVMGVLR
jgi:drug/metabolite transporter (DMT)-like permease